MLFYAAALQTLNYDWDTLDLWGVDECRSVSSNEAPLLRLAKRDPENRVDVLYRSRTQVPLPSSIQKGLNLLRVQPGQPDATQSWSQMVIDDPRVAAVGFGPNSRLGALPQPIRQEIGHGLTFAGYWQA